MDEFHYFLIGATYQLVYLLCCVYNKFFLFAYPKCLEVDENDWEHFEYFEKTNGHLYTPPNLVINNDTTPKKEVV